ncbi:tetratricopeptide repeat protein [Fulvivirga sedimenti]|uniref:Tetratricopeptide repeat protein n=1 Tax=Fulvivirga sedimenti TaxID=2879465 RepID=A0A9X1KXS9_9BACT|nr:tetratricopeptide repeat protein [Fulvivirga sedimenti]MCA6074933.1 tetratricopeptide repeat protein [Fulvivirga sedimenti]MCA6076110.1 tetratricopeptide repeat protein [Fulvivirga sedimenti]MCA6077238.1 tetratricopeptide repeat protein [Fulvivirga sedimenti]
MKTLLTLIFCLITTAAFNQTPEADQYLRNNEFEKAEKLYLSYLENHPGDSMAMFRLGRAYSGLQQWSNAEMYYKKAAAHNFPVSATAFQIAQNYLHQQNNREAMKALNEGAAAGMRNYIRLTQDPLFTTLHSHPDWQQLLEKVELNTYPCLSQPEARQFDFWIGSWDVHLNGAKVGENQITRANGGCAIHENYTTFPRDYTGQSINFYDPLEKRWHQHWVGSGGDITNYYETGKSEGVLEFTGQMINASGVEITNRMTFTLLENGNVRQLIETSLDKGKSWSSSFDGLYIPQKND